MYNTIDTNTGTSDILSTKSCSSKKKQSNIKGAAFVSTTYALVSYLVDVTVHEAR